MKEITENGTKGGSCSAYPPTQTTEQKRRSEFPPADTLEQLTRLYRSGVARSGRPYRGSEHTDEALRCASEWLLKRNYHSLLLMGGVGTGKTMLLGALHRFFRVHLRDEVLGCGDVVYGSFLCSASKLAKFNDERQRIAATASVLLVDDVGVEPAVVSSYGTTSTPLVDVLCERYERRRPTVISTNLNAEALRERYGERIHDRMCEVYARIPFNFTSFRQP